MVTIPRPYPGGGDVNSGNNSSSDPTTIAGGPDLTIAKSHIGNFTQGQVGAVYNVTVTNSGATGDSGTVTVADTSFGRLDTDGGGGHRLGLHIVVQAVSCTRNDALGTGQSYSSSKSR